MRLVSGAILVGALAVAFAGCPEQDLDPEEFPNGWWKLDASAADTGAVRDAQPVPADAGVPGAPDAEPGSDATP